MSAEEANVPEATPEPVADQADSKSSDFVTTQDTPVSEKAAKWCRRVAKIAANRAFRTKSLAGLAAGFDPDKVEFLALSTARSRQRVTHTDGTSKIFLSIEFFDHKFNLRKKMDPALREELKAAIYSAVAHFAHPRVNADFFKVMTRCQWTGPRVLGAPGSTQEARKVLTEKKEARLARHVPAEEVPTGLKEDVLMWDLLGRRHVLVRNADIFLTKDNHIKIARGEFEGRKLRTMLSGGSALKQKLGL